MVYENVVTLSADTAKEMIQRNYTVAGFLDMSSAFDYVDKCFLCENLSGMNLSPIMSVNYPPTDELKSGILVMFS